METLSSVRRPVRELRPGDHAWLAYSGEDEQRHVVGSFVRDGLEAAHKIIYLAGSDDVDVPGMHGVRARPGLLTVVPLADARRPDGGFDPGTVLAALTGEIAGAEDGDYTTIRVTADMTFALDLPGGLGELLRCERHIERAVCPSTRVTAICQIDRRRLSADARTALAATHSTFVTPNPEFADSVLQIVRTFDPVGLSLLGELDASRHTVLDEALNKVLGASRGEEIHLDLAGLGFIDLGALNMLADVAARRSGTGPLVLDRMPLQLRTIMETVGWHMLPGLRLGTV
ncbi:STAS domain-containing protein [Actinomadura logoneensis]|uniref:STAS domain-containing protein n=1 Tax=Actinomadura logoneensis TaxID=2293572 RepID=A0A372J974_9ACTN|nr:MEDS domain-containing protein [Actinomadura logoneensis]RFU36555.1 STAS domain-containing protein [Actinomadura logoneensis]